MKNKTDGKSYRCKSCDDEARRKWSKKHPEKAQKSQRERQLRMKYGIDLGIYEELLERQGGKCALCEAEKNSNSGYRSEWSFSVDHCHQTGTVRGLLCNNCNRGIGLLLDSPALLRKAADYIQRSRRESAN
jgi:hypothetical protein